eukprot:SAG11_NODE_5315_length_1599_cov_0.970000_1_plen_25_part_10
MAPHLFSLKIFSLQREYIYFLFINN